MTTKQEQFIEQCKSNGFTALQSYEVFLGFSHGLSFEEVNVLANKEFNEKQMAQIRYGFQKGLSAKQVNLFAKPEFAWKQMEEIRLGFLDGLTFEQVSLYAKKEFNFMQMDEMSRGFHSGLSIEQVSFYANPEFHYRQMSRIREGFKSGLTFEQVSCQCMLTPEQVKFIEQCKNEGFTQIPTGQIEQVMEGFEQGLSIEQVKTYAKKELNHVQMMFMRQDLVAGLPVEKVSLYEHHVLCRMKNYEVEKIFNVRKILDTNEDIETIKAKVNSMLLAS